MKKTRLWLAALLTLAILMCAGAALAAGDSLKFAMELSTSEFYEPKTISVSFTVTNTGSSEMPGPIMLFYPDGRQVEEFGAPILGAGSSKNWTGQYSVTEEELKAGKISFKVAYTDYDDNGEAKQYAVLVRKNIIYAGAEPRLTVTRTIAPQVAEEGQEITIIYELTNDSPSDVTAVTVQESAGGKERVSLGDLKTGETARHAFTVKMKKKDLASQGVVTYKAGGKTYTTKVDAAAIKYGKVNLTASLSADKKGGAPGDTVKLTLTLKNTGTTDFTGVTVTDAALGTVFSGQTVKAGEKVTLETDVVIEESREYLFTVRGDNGTGITAETATGKVQVLATDPDRQIALRTEIAADRDTVYEIPGDVRFTVTVTNTGTTDVENVRVKAGGVTLYTFPRIPAGESRTFTRELAVSMAGIFRFTAEVKDQLGETAAFESNDVEIAYSDTPAAPATPDPVVLPPQPAELTPPPQPTELTPPPKPAELTQPPQPDPTAGTEEEIAQAQQEWEAQAAEIARQNETLADEWEAQKAEVDKKNAQALSEWEKQKAEINDKNAQALRDWEAETERLKEQQADVSRWPAAKTEGWDVLDVSDYPLKDASKEPKTRAELMNNGLLLINEWHSRPADFDESGIQSYSKYTNVKQKIQVDNHNIALFPAAWDALLEAITDAKSAAELEHYIITEGYRTWEKQNDLFQKRKDKLASKYSSETDLIAAAKKEVNYPGTSEFNSGLAFTLGVYQKGNSDLNSAKYSSTAQGIWMNENCWKYGLIFRFPEAEWPLPESQDKSFITGVSVKLNAYRFVGRGNAAFMHCLDMCLEEYIEYLHAHPHLALYEDGTLKYEVYCQNVGDAAAVEVELTEAKSHVSSLDNMGYVITVFEH